MSTAGSRRAVDGRLSVDGPLVATTGLFALAPAAVAMLLVAGLRQHRPDLRVPPASMVVLLIGLSGWAAMLAAAVSARGSSPRRTEPSGDPDRVVVPLVGAVHLLVAFGVLVRLRLAGAGDGTRYPLTGLILPLVVGTGGLVLLAGLVRALRAAPWSLEDDVVLSRVGRFAVVAAVVAVLVVGLAGYDHGDHPRLRLLGAGVRPGAMVAPLVVAAFALAVISFDPRLVGRYSYDEQGDRAATARVATAMLVIIGLGLVPILGTRHPVPAFATVVALAVLVAALTGHRGLPAAGCGLVLLEYLLIAWAQGVFHHDNGSRAAALALARGGLLGSGPGQGLVEAYEPGQGVGAGGGPTGTGLVADRYALNVLAEEVGRVGLIVVLVAAVMIGLLVVRLAARAGRGPLGAWAWSLAAATAVTLALPLVPLAWSNVNVEAALPGVASDGVGLVVLLWTVGALVGVASGREVSDTAPPDPELRSRVPLGGVSRVRSDRWTWLERRCRRSAPGLVAAGCALLVLVAVMVGPSSAQHQRAGVAREDQWIRDADRQRIGMFGGVPLGWPTADGIDPTVRKVLDDTVGTVPRCAARPPAQARGDGLGPGCPPLPTAVLDVKGQRAAFRALEESGFDGSVVTVEVGSGRLPVLANSGADAAGWWAAAPIGGMTRHLLAATLNSDATLGRAVLGDLRRAELTEHAADLLKADPAFDAGMVDRARHSPQSTEPALAPLFTAVDRRISDRYRRCVSDFGSYDAPPRFASDGDCPLRLAGAVLADGGGPGHPSVSGQSGKATQPDSSTPAPPPPAPSPPPPARDLPSLSRDALAAVLTTGLGAAGEPPEGLVGALPTSRSVAGITAASGGDCGDVDRCLRASPLTLTVVVAALVCLQDQSTRELPVPRLLAGYVVSEPKPVPVSLGPTAVGTLGRERVSGREHATTVPDGVGGAWSVRILPKRSGHRQVVLVGHLRPEGGAAKDRQEQAAATARSTQTAAGTVLDKVAHALDD